MGNLTKNQVINLIEANPSLNRKTSPIALQNIRTYYKEIYNDNNVIYQVAKRRRYSTLHKNCHGCLMNQLNALRIYAGYPKEKNRLDKKLINKRIQICVNCNHSKGSGIFTTCGTPIVGDKQKGLLLSNVGCVIMISGQ